MRSIICPGAFRNFSFIILLLVTAGVKAQHIDSVLQHLSSRMQLNEYAPPSADLFLHIDKTLYSPAESIWIAAYLLNGKETELHHTLHVLLVNDMTRKAVRSEDFVLDHGIGSGSFYIPDSLETGEYSVIAYTNRFSNQKNERFFRKAITIASSQTPFKIMFSGSIKGDSLFVNGKVQGIGGEAVPGATFSYTIYSDGIPHLKPVQKTDASGGIKFSVPKFDITGRLEILGTVSKGKEKMNYKYPLHWSSNVFYINFYPENGRLDADHLSYVAFGIKNTSGKGVAERCVLLENGKAISSVSSDQYGNGVIRFIPLENKIYQVKIEGNPELPIQQFPPVTKNNWSVQGDNRVKDSLDIRIVSPAAGSECFVIIDNSREMLYGSKIKLPKGTGRFRIPAADWPSGIANISILDYQKVLQRKKSIFIDKQEDINVSVNTDSAKYHKLSKVKVHIALRDKENKPVKGMFSLSAVANQVYDSCSADIYRFKAYDRFLPQTVVLPPGSYLGKDQNMENTLYYLANETRERVEDVNISYPQSDRDGYVLYYEKPLKKPITLILAGAATSVLTTDERGNFKLPYELLRGAQGAKVILSVVAKRPMGYRIVLVSSKKQIDDFLSRKYFMLDHFDGDELTTEQKMILRSKTSNLLNEVTIKGKPNRSKEYFGKADSSSVCDDYVCRLNFLNCLVHPRGSQGTTIPRDGQKYLIEGLAGTEEITYHCKFMGLEPYVKPIATTAYPADFPVFNIAENNIQESLSRTTLHWQKDISTDDKGEADVYFYTNEKRGDFLITLQGMSSKGVFGKQIRFKVME